MSCYIHKYTHMDILSGCECIKVNWNFKDVSAVHDVFHIYYLYIFCIINVSVITCWLPSLCVLKVKYIKQAVRFEFLWIAEISSILNPFKAFFIAPYSKNFYLICNWKKFPMANFLVAASALNSIHCSEWA